MAGKIKITKYNEMLATPDHLGDEVELSPEVGIHEVCFGSISLVDVSETHAALVCDTCGLRVMIPREVNTYGELKGYFIALAMPSGIWVTTEVEEGGQDGG